MKPIEKYFPILKRALDQYEKDHPYWETEILVSIIKRALERLKFFIENASDSKITWYNPFVELHFPIGWNWKKRGPDVDIAPGGHIYGKITPRNTATKEMARKTLFGIMDNQLHATVLANVTNWTWYEKLKNHYTPALPIQLISELYTIADKQKRREHFDKLMRPFSIGVTRTDFNEAKFKSGKRVPRRVAKQIFETNKPDIEQVRIQGEVNGRCFDAWLAFEIHPLIADYDRKKAYHPIVIGLGFTTRMEGNDIVEDSPADWPRADREKFWEGLFKEVQKMTEKLIPKQKDQESVILHVNSKVKIPAEWWRPENQSATIKLIADLQGHIGEITEFAVGQPEKIQDRTHQTTCNICHWVHDVSFTQIKVDKNKVISLGGVLPNIIAAVHRAHERGLPALSTKDDELQRICGSYKHPSKAFDDLNHRDDYKILFTRRRGFISLRAASGINPE